MAQASHTDLNCLLENLSVDKQTLMWIQFFNWQLTPRFLQTPHVHSHKKHLPPNTITQATSWALEAFTGSNKCLTSSNRCLTSSNKKLVVTSASLVVASALLVVTFEAFTPNYQPVESLRGCHSGTGPCDLEELLASLGPEAIERPQRMRKKRNQSYLIAMASNLRAMASNLVVMASNLRASV